MSNDNALRRQWGRRACDKKLRFYRKNASGKVLDYGCGFGIYGLSLMAYGLDVYFADVDLMFLDSLEVPHSRINLVMKDSFPFPDDAFDTLLLGDVLEHVDDIGTFWAEACRVARKAILVSVPRRDTPKLFQTLGITWKAYEDPTHKRYFEAEDLRKLVSEKFACCEIYRYFPRTRFRLLLDMLEKIGFYPGYLARYTSSE